MEWKNWCYGSFMVMTILQMSASIEFPCDFDICDTDNGQYCNEDENRCSYCSCDLPQSVIPECLKICTEKAVTTTPKPTTSIAPSSQNLGSGNDTYLTIAVSIILAAIILLIIIVFYLYKTKQFCFRPQTPNSTPSSSAMSSDESLIKDKPNDLEINMEDSPIDGKKKSPTQEEGHKLLDGADQIHTSPTADVHFDQHKRVFSDPDEIAIIKHKQAESEETSLKQI